MKTSIVSGLAAAAISLALAGPTFAQDANVTGELHVVGFSGVFADNYQKFIIAPFEQRAAPKWVRFAQPSDDAKKASQRGRWVRSSADHIPLWRLSSSHRVRFARRRHRP